jgi:GNAT superfamily N-acetyltransferase
VIRRGTLDDVAQAATMRQRAWPDLIVTEEGMRHALESTPDRAELEMLAFEEGGEILGWATAGRSWERSETGHGDLSISVEPSRRGEGVGSALAAAADRHLDALGIATTHAGSLDEPAAHALAARLGFHAIGASSTSAVDPRTIERLPIPDGIELVAFADIQDPRPLYALDLEVCRDIPNEVYENVTFEEWCNDSWKAPFIDEDASLAAYVDGELAGLTMIRIDRPSGRAHNNIAGVRRTFRGRGLAHLLKSHSLSRAAELGATIAVTDNDETNAAMLAVNAKLGYRPFGRRIEWERVTGAR